MSICDLHDEALRKIIDEFKIPIKIPILKTQSAKNYRIEQIEEWIRKNRPNWEKDEKGFFVAEFSALSFNKKAYLKCLTIMQLQVFAKHLKLEIDFKGKMKSELVKEITSKTREKYPEFKVTQNGELIIDPIHFK